jgi:low temperature requirement protein LtrA
VKGIELPERTEDFTADPVELFFDLAYVFAFSQLVRVLINDPTWSGAGEAALLFGLLWVPWQQLTWSANAVSGNGRRIRIIFLVATAACVPMAAATSSALDAGGLLFAITLGVIMTLGFLIQSLGAAGSDFQQSVVRWVTPNLLAVIVLLIGAFTEGTARTTIWLLGLGIVLAAMVAAGRGPWLIRSGHMAERHGLIVIVALGEVIVAIGLPVVDTLEAGAGLTAQTVVALIASGAFASLLWWAYFDRPGPALEHRGEAIEGDSERGRFVRDVYTWAHAPVVAGIILAAAALEEIALHPSDPVALSFRLMLLGGLVLMLGGIAAAIWRAFHAPTTERIVATVAVAATVAAAGSWDGVVLLGAVVVILGVTLVAEHLRIEG